MSRLVRVALALAAWTLSGCGAVEPEPQPDRHLTPTYNRESGRLERIASDRNGDGRDDAWAYMDGPRLDRIEMDRDEDGELDRIEYYELPSDEGSGTDLARAVIARAEEGRSPAHPPKLAAREGPSNVPIRSPDWVVTRREIFEGGALRRVEEDTNADGRMNRWEEHTGGRLVRMDLDLTGRGTPDRRLVYAPGGTTRIEIDPDGDGAFEPAPLVGQQP